MRRSIVISVHFGKPVELEKLRAHKPILETQGVYLLVEGKPTTNPQHEKIFYIGKAISETIFSRVQKHLWAILERKSKTGKSVVNPGSRFIVFSAKKRNQLTNLWLVPGFMPRAKPYQISCAEELLLYDFCKIHGRLPEANTHKPPGLISVPKGAGDKSERQTIPVPGTIATTTAIIEQPAPPEWDGRVALKPKRKRK